MPRDEAAVNYDKVFDDLLDAEAKAPELNITIPSKDAPDITLSLSQEQVRQLTDDQLEYAHDKHPSVKPITGQHSLLED